VINLLPHNLRSERRYGRLNILIVKQLVGLLLIGVLAVGVMLSGLQITADDEKFLDNSIAIKTDIYNEIKIYETQANDLKSDVATIEKLFEREVQFSKLLVEIASSIPVGAQLTGLSLTGANTAPLQITADTTTQELAGTLRRNLVDSGVFESADLQSVIIVSGTGDTADTYSVSLSATLSGSAERIKKEKAAQAAQAATAAQAAQAASQQDGGN
jgi:Tfp pilus assembly protein PilN